MAKRHTVNGTPGAIVAALAELQSERRAAGARVDALDLAIDNLQRAYGLNGHATSTSPATPRQARRAARDDGASDERRELILTALARSEHGLTLGELRKATPKMDGKARSNVLQRLKAAGKVKRAGNAWVVA
jgi:ribosomal protein S30